MHYLIFIIVTLSGVGPRAGYPTVTNEVKIAAPADNVQVVYVAQRRCFRWDWRVFLP